MPAIRPLSGLDAAFLYLEGLGTPMHVGSLMLLKPPARGSKNFRTRLRDHVAARLSSAAPLRRVLEHAPLGMGHPLWREFAALDLDWHIAQQRVRAPGSRQALMSLVSRLHAEAMPRDRPMWQLVVIEGLDDGCVALYSRIHHALLDGQGGVALARALLDLEPDPPPYTPRSDARAPSTPSGTSKRASSAAGATLGQLGRLFRSIPATVRMAASGASSPRQSLASLREAVLLAPRTLFNVQIGAQRAFAVASLDLGRCKRVAKAHGASLNDLVMALCTTVLRDALSRRKALPKQAMIAGMPVSLRAADDDQANNQVSMVQCELPTDEANPAARLQRIRASTAEIKTRLQVFSSLIPKDFPGLAAPFWASGLSRLWARGRLSEKLPPLANLVISNVPGPPVPLYLAGAQVLNYYPISIVTHGLGLNITVQSYAGSLEFGVLSCHDAFPRPQSLTERLELALNELEQCIAQ